MAHDITRMGPRIAPRELPPAPPALAGYADWRADFGRRLDVLSDVSYDTASAAPYAAPPVGWDKSRALDIIGDAQSIDRENEYHRDVKDLRADFKQGGDEKAIRAWREFEDAKRKYAEFQGRVYASSPQGEYRRLQLRDSDIVHTRESRALVNEVLRAERSLAAALSAWQRQAGTRLDDLEHKQVDYKYHAQEKRPVKVAGADAESARAFRERIDSRQSLSRRRAQAQAELSRSRKPDLTVHEDLANMSDRILGRRRSNGGNGRRRRRNPARGRAVTFTRK